MFKKIYKIEKVNKGYWYGDKILIYQSKNYLRRIDLQTEKLLNEIELSNDLNIQNISVRNNYIIGLCSAKLAFFDNKLENISLINFDYSEYNLYDNKFLMSILEFDYASMEGKYGLYDLDLKSNIWKIDTGQILKVESGIVFAMSPKEISRLDIITGNIIWRNQLNNQKLIPKLIGILNSIVIFGLQSSENIFAFDISTGELKWEKKAFPQLYKLDSKQGYLYALSSGFTKLDVNTGEVLDMFVDREYFDVQGIFSQRGNYAFTGNHIITTDSKLGKIGAFNTTTHEFDWIYSIEGVSFPAANPILYEDPYLLIHDNKGDLHIFEKEHHNI